MWQRQTHRRPISFRDEAGRLRVVYPDVVASEAHLGVDRQANVT